MAGPERLPLKPCAARDDKRDEARADSLMRPGLAPLTGPALPPSLGSPARLFFFVSRSATRGGPLKLRADRADNRPLPVYEGSDTRNVRAKNTRFVLYRIGSGGVNMLLGRKYGKGGDVGTITTLLAMVSLLPVIYLVVLQLLAYRRRRRK